MDWKASYDPLLKFTKGKASLLLFWKVLQVDAHNFLKGYNLPRIYKSNRFIVKDAAFNTIYAQNLRIMAGLCQLVGDEEGQHFLRQAVKTEKNILRYMYDEKDAAFYDLHGHHFEKLRVRTATLFSRWRCRACRTRCAGRCWKDTCCTRTAFMCLSRFPRLL